MELIIVESSIPFRCRVKEDENKVLSDFLNAALHDVEHTFDEVGIMLVKEEEGFYLCQNMGAYYAEFADDIPNCYAEKIVDIDLEKEEWWVVYRDVTTNPEQHTAIIKGDLLRKLFHVACGLYYQFTD